MSQDLGTAAGERGQASVELVALLPLAAILALALWQLALAGYAAWAAGGAAGAAARARAIGRDPLAAARRALPGALRAAVRVRDSGDGAVRVTIGVPLVVGSGTLLDVDHRARLPAQR